jgi:hypothetical protein
MLEFYSIFASGSPNRSIHRTFQADFEMTSGRSSLSLIKTGKNHYRNPIYLAREWRRALDSGEHPSRAALSRQLKVSRARVTQIMNLLRLSPEALEMISSLGDPLDSPMVLERRLRSLLGMVADEQMHAVRTLLSSR